MRRQSTRYYDLLAVPSFVRELSLPTACTQQFGIDLIKRHREYGFQELERDSSNNCFSVMSIHRFGAAVPEGDPVSHAGEKIAS